MNDTAVMAIDAGQTGIKVRLAAGPSREELLFDGIDTHRPLLPQLAEVVRQTITRTQSSPTLVTAGISGLTDRDADADAMLALVHGSGIRRVALAHDSTTSFLGALGRRHGAVVAAGTGVVTLAVGPHAVARVDGWGYVMGDAGSGYWIGREALDAVMRAYDGRGAPTVLADPVRERWPDLEQAYISLQAEPERVRIVASFAAAVAAAAAEGDEIARRITTRAAAELAASAAAAMKRVRLDDEPFSVCAMGGVFGSTLLREEFTAAVTGPGVGVVPAAGAGIDGAEALADLDDDHPLDAVVHRAGAV